MVLCVLEIMAYTTFSTDNADYVLQLGNHSTENKQVDIFEGIDALVLETGKNILQDFVTKKYIHPQYKLPFQYCTDSCIPVFGTDVRGTTVGYLRQGLSGIIAGLPTFGPELYYSLSEKRVPNLILDCCADWNFLSQRPRIECRNAINARKVEEYVAPLLAGRLGRKPYLGLIFGAGHMGLKPDLQSKRRRDFTIWNWRNFNFGKWAGFVEEDLNVVQEANYNGKGWEIQTHIPNLFD